jgi:hypothetical protein
MAASDYFEFVADQLASEQLLGFVKHRPQGLVQMSSVIREADHADLSTLPSVLVVQLGYRDVETRPQPIL